MLRFAQLLVSALVLLCLAGNGLGSDEFDIASHHAAPPTPATWVGREDKLAGLDVYVSGSPSAPAAVILISDVFGWKAPLFRKLADKIAASGYYAVAPDYFRGDSLTNLTEVPTWIVRHPPAGEVGTTNELVKALKGKGMQSVGLAGFCWGAKVAVLVGKQTGHVKAVVQAHPAMVAASDYAEVAVPIAILAAPSDGVDKFEEVLRMRRKELGLKVYLKIFTGVQHGWTVRYDETDKKAVKKANRAHMLLLKWFHKHL